LVQQFELSPIQAQAILDMQLQRLTGLERKKVLDELAELQVLIEELRSILGSETRLMEIVIKELREVQTKYTDERRTEIVSDPGELRIEDLIVEEDMAITVSNTGYVKRTAITEYRSQRRGGKGRMGMRTRDEDFLTHLFVASTHAYILIFSDRGRVYWLKVHTIPDIGPSGRGKAIANLVSMQAGEKIAALLAVREWPERDGERYIVTGTRRGGIKKTDLRSFRNPRQGGIIAASVADDDAVIAAEITDGHGEVFIGTRSGKAIRFAERDVRPMGRTARGVRGIRLRAGDEVVAMAVVRPAGTLLTVTEHGYGKRTELDEYRVQSRGGVGIISIQTTARNGRVAGVAYVEDEDELMLITQQGKVLRMDTKDLRAIGRATQGVRMIEIDATDRVVSLARLVDAPVAVSTTAVDGDAGG
jgi:DNA gyrase subunit A